MAGAVTPEPAATRRPVSVRGVALALAAALLLSWPMLVLTAPLLFQDVPSYVNQGHEVVLALLHALGLGAPGGAGTADFVSSRGLRSAPYAAFVYLASRPFGLVAPALVQASLTLLMLGALFRRETEAPPAAVAMTVLLCGTLTSLPWFVSFPMPDILAAVVVLYAMVLVRTFDGLGPWQRAGLCAIAAFATMSHYGHIPLAAACTGAALLVLLVRRRLTWFVTLAGVAPLALAVGANVLLGLAAYDGPSVAPRRLPLLLARSVEDGPARWYLEEACPTAGYSVCALFEDRMPDNVRDVLWGERGLNRLSPEDMARVREEEPTILWRAFLEYPGRQLWSLVGNGVRQLVSVGTSEFSWVEVGYSANGALRLAFDWDRDRGLLEAFGWLHLATVAAGALTILGLARADGLTAGFRERETAGILVVGLLANAAIFGGLSAPADRYQSRIAWIVPVLAALFVLDRLRQSRTAWEGPRIWKDRRDEG